MHTFFLIKRRCWVQHVNMVLPDTAFTSNFTIKLAGDEQLYVADVAKKEDAQDTYNEAVKEGQTVGLVNTETRDANRLSVRYVHE